MNTHDFTIIAIFIIALIACALPIGMLIAHLFQGKRTFLHGFLGWFEKLTYEFARINSQEEMTWRRYTKNVLWFSAFSLLFLFLILRFQAWLPFNPQEMPNVPSALAWNIAVSFVTNTNWQSYAGETTLSYGSQMWGLTVQNFLSAGVGGAVLLAFIRGLTRKCSDTIGNFWGDLVRLVLYVLLPLSLLFSFILVEQGVIQTLSPYQDIETIEGQKQTIPLGPVASQVAIKLLGTNGGGFFNANGAHPFENPTYFSNFLQTLALCVLPLASLIAFGIVANAKKQAWVLAVIMFLLWLGGTALSIYSESLHNPILTDYPLWEGREIRFGNTESLMWANMTTGTSNGAINAMHSSLTPLTGGVLLFNMMLGEVIFGGFGTGLCMMLIYVLLTVFLSGLMVGRAPEFMGKKIDIREMQWVMVTILVPSFLILIGASIVCVVPQASDDLNAAGPHKLTTLLYAFTSTAMNNGSAFANINANTNFYNNILAIVMLLGRLAILIPSLALAGSLAAKKITPVSLGTLATNTFLFGAMLVFIMLCVCALTFFPALTLGPLIEHLLMLRGQTFN